MWAARTQHFPASAALSQNNCSEVEGGGGGGDERDKETTQSSIIISAWGRVVGVLKREMCFEGVSVDIGAADKHTCVIICLPTLYISKGIFIGQQKV